MSLKDKAKSVFSKQCLGSSEWEKKEDACYQKEEVALAKVGRRKEEQEGLVSCHVLASPHYLLCS